MANGAMMLKKRATFGGILCQRRPRNRQSANKRQQNAHHMPPHGHLQAAVWPGASPRTLMQVMMCTENEKAPVTGGRLLSRGAQASGQLCRHILRDVEVVRHRLDVIILFQKVDQPHQLFRRLQIHLGARLRAPDQL